MEDPMGQLANPAYRQDANGQTHTQDEDEQQDYSPVPGPSRSGSGSYSPSSRSPTPPLTPPTPHPPLPSSLLQSIFASYPLPISLPFPQSHPDPQKRTVCKHWLRGLCKKSDATCDYLHEYDMRKMPECRMFATFGFCNSGEDCLYRHKLPREKRRECEEYRRGFCPRGPECAKKHLRRTVCPYYVAGFCPKGPECKQGHPKSSIPSPHSRRTSPILNHKPLSAEEAFGPPPHLREGGDQSRPPRREGGPPGDRRGGDRSMRGQGDRPGGGGGRDHSQVLCFKCGETGHYANHCPNPNRPGNRGGADRDDRGGRGAGRPAPY